MKIGNILVFSVLTVFVLVSVLFSIFGDYFWFSSLGYENVFLKILLTNAGLGCLFGAAFAGFALINLRIAKRLSPGRKGKSYKSIDSFLVFAILFVSFLMAMGFARWEVVLKYLNATSFGINDPVFGLDMGFYIFSLPFFLFLLGFLLISVIFSLSITLLAYFFYSGSLARLDEEDEFEDTKVYGIKLDFLGEGAKKHVSFLAGLLFLVLSCGIYLSRYFVLLSPGGAVFGAGYTDLTVVLPLLTILVPVSALAGIGFMLSPAIKIPNIRAYILALFIGLIILGFAVSGIVQAFVVTPNEFNLEKPYIERNIQNTLNAYDLNNVEEKVFEISYNLTMDDIEKNRGTIDNIRLWDWRPLMQTYNQLQLFRTYYHFWDIDIDRYEINDHYKQVMISARGIDVRSLPEDAQTWVNTHLVYTHGYGVVMNPVDKVTKEGLPEFYIKDVPPVSDYFEVTRPEIYYGEGFENYAVVKTTTEEFDYPSGEKNVYSTYEGRGGVEISDSFRRLVYAVKFGSVELLVSGSIKPESRILLYRDIRERVRKIADFLLYDSDPYVVISNGRLYWIMDGYTFASTYPYSEPIYLSGEDISLNYVRNSVKVVIDAYNGDVRFYVVDRKDPLIRTYEKIFPKLFLDFEEMDPDLKKHIRYPEDLFRIQAELYSIYHMKNPRVFYNKEDTWVIPNEIYRGGRQEMKPYYIMAKLPGNEKEEFILMIPFIPKGKENLIAWVAARCDLPNYGKLVVFKFSKQVLTYGPMQIEARIDQDTEISQRITLWSQAGSSVIRGNTLVIPIENSIIYIEPLFLEATEKGTLPELKRVILAYGDRLVMRETLEEAVEEIFRGEAKVTPLTEQKVPEDILKQIAEVYGRAKDALRSGDLAEYARYIDQIGEILENWSG